MVEAVLAAWFLFALIPAYIARRRGTNVIFFYLLALVFWPVAMILVFIVPRKQKLALPKQGGGGHDSVVARS